MDCSDPTCTSFACVPAVPTAPTGWTGYFEVYDGPSMPNLTCAGDFATQQFLGNKGLDVAAATCSCSTCTATGQTCNATGMADTQHTGNVDVIVAIDATCTGSPQCGGGLDEAPTWAGACDGMDLLPKVSTCGAGAGTDCTMGTAACNVSVEMQALVVNGGSCPGGSTVTVTKPMPTWSSVGLACGGATVGTGCSGTETCLPKPDNGFGSTLCVMKAGDNDCPAGQFTNQHVFYTGFTGDSRGCSACGCGATATGGDCSATVEVYSSASCTGSPVVTLNPTTAAGDCQPVSGNPVLQSRKATFTAPTGGTCATTGGVPNGTLPVADETTAVTFCCL